MSLKKCEETRQEKIEDAHGGLDEEREDERNTVVCT